jgi:3-deoxy-7-phosphoheptulonate synthase
VTQRDEFSDLTAEANDVDQLMAAEYIAQRGNLDIVLCERGIRTFETATRNTLDISAVPVAQRLSHLPVIVDPSHSGGRRDLVLPLSRAAVVAGADGVIVDVHPEPDVALCDGPQALVPRTSRSTWDANRADAATRTRADTFTSEGIGSTRGSTQTSVHDRISDPHRRHGAR